MDVCPYVSDDTDCLLPEGHDGPHGTPINPCPMCGQHISDRILSDSPDCPHGWVNLDTLSHADVKALFADDCDGPGLSVGTDGSLGRGVPLAWGRAPEGVDESEGQ